MLKKLRLKFIIINMSIVVIMLGIIFGLLYYSTAGNLERESLQMMRSVAMEPPQPGQPMMPSDDVRLPYFSVIVDRNGKAMEIGGGFFDLSDEETLDAIIAQADKLEDASGVLRDYNLRFVRTDTPMGKHYVFADITSEQSTLHNLIKNFAIIGSAAFAAFLLISVLLARWAVKPVEKAWQQQKQFVADASHELKTPLTVIMTDAELLNSPDCPEADRRQLTDSISSMSVQMRGLVESLLELARIDSGSVKGASEPVSMSDTAAEAAMVFEPVFFEKDMVFTYEVEPDIVINGNGAQLRQLAEILLDNAAKYASSNADVSLTLKKSSPRQCRLEVSNRGEPIAAGDMENLFKRFYRADKARAMNHSYGLGLSIAESIVSSHKGSIRAESREGYNRFIVELPIAVK